MIKVRSAIGKFLLHFSLIGWTFLVITPFILIVLLSFRNNAGIFTSTFSFEGGLHPENYEVAWNGAAGTGAMSTYFLNSIIVAITALVVNLVAGVTAAYFSIYMKEKNRARYLRVFVVATVLPFIMLLIPLYQTFNVLGVINMPVAVGIAYSVLSLPTTVLIVHAGYIDFPRELTEAAALDGIGPWRTLIQVVLPLSRGAIIAVGMLTLIFVWGETQLGVVLLQTPQSQTVPVGLLAFQGQFFSDLGAIFAGLSIAAVPIMIVYLIFNRFVSKGIALGGFGGR